MWRGVPPSAPRVSRRKGVRLHGEHPMISVTDLKGSYRRAEVVGPVDGLADPQVLVVDADGVEWLVPQAVWDKTTD